MDNKSPVQICNELQQYAINGKLNRKQSEKVKPLLNSLFDLFMKRQLPNNLLKELNLIQRGKTKVFDEFKILAIYNEMDFKEIYRLFTITECDLHNLKNYYAMHYYKYPLREFAQLKNKQPYAFQGLANERSIVIYNVSLKALNSISDLRFKILSVNDFEINILLGDKGRRTKFYPDRALKFVFPKNLFTNKKVKVKVYTKKSEIITILNEIKGRKKLMPSKTWFKAKLTPLKHCFLVTVNSKALRKIFCSKGIHSVYCDVRNNYVIIEPSTLKPSRKSYIANIYPSGKIGFTIPKNKPLQFVGISGIAINSIKGFFQTEEELKVAEGLLNKGYNILAISHQQQQDLKILHVADNNITALAAMQIKNIKLNSPSLGHVFGDLYKCFRFSSRTSKKSFFLINSHWKKHPYFTEFEGESTTVFSEKHNTHIIFTDYCNDWQNTVVSKIEAHL